MTFADPSREFKDAELLPLADGLADDATKGSFSILIVGKQYLEHFQNPENAVFIGDLLCIKGRI